MGELKPSQAQDLNRLGFTQPWSVSDCLIVTICCCVLAVVINSTRFKLSERGTSHFADVLSSEPLFGRGVQVQMT